MSPGEHESDEKRPHSLEVSPMPHPWPWQPYRHTDGTVPGREPLRLERSDADTAQSIARKMREWSTRRSGGAMAGWDYVLRGVSDLVRQFN